MRLDRLTSLTVLVALTAWQTKAKAGDPIDWAKVAEALGKPGEMQPGGVYRVGLPRGDLHVTLAGVQIKPALALGAWVGFEPTGPNEVTAMGDLVLLENEVGPVTAKLQEGGIEQTAIHNHLLHETPHVMYVHFRAEGDPIKTATAIHAALALTRTPFASPAGKSESIGLDTAQVSQVLGRSGKVNGGVYQVSAPRAETIHEGGMEVPRSHGRGHRAQLSADRRKQGRDHRRLCPRSAARSIRSFGRAAERHRGHGAAQSHARRISAALLHAFLGQCRRPGAGPGAPGSPRQDAPEAGDLIGEVTG